MKKYLVALSLWCSLSGVLQAKTIELPDNINIYGKAEIQAVNADAGVMKRVEAGNNINSVFSRLGVSGNYQLNDSVKLVFKYEWQVKGFDDDNKDDLFSARNTYIGLASDNYGSVLLGRNDTRFKKIEGSVDQFKEREGNLKQVFSGQDRIGDTITYIAPKWQGVTAGMTIVLGDDAENQEEEKSGFSLGVHYGDSKLKKQDIYLAAGLNKDVLGVDAWRMIARIKLGAVKLGAMYQSSEKDSADKDGSGYMVNLAIPFASHYEAKLQYSRDDAKLIHSEEVDMLTAGVDYNFSKQAKVYAMFTTFDLETSEDKVASLGLRYSF